MMTANDQIVMRHVDALASRRVIPMMESALMGQGQRGEATGLVLPCGPLRLPGAMREGVYFVG